MTMELITTPTAQIVSAEKFGGGLIERFVKFAGVSLSSQKTYAKCLRQMFGYFDANAISKPTRENLIDWVEELKKPVLVRDDVKEKSPSTIQLYLTAAKIFFRWASQEGLYANIADHMKSGIKPAAGHNRSVKGGDEKDCRDRAILTLMTTAGLRTIEVVRANFEDMRFERGKRYLYVQGKGHSAADEKVLLSDETYRAIKEYLMVRGMSRLKSKSPLFVSTWSNQHCCRGSRLDTQTIRKMVKERLRGIGLDDPRLTAHSLRHSVATNLIEAGVELPKVQMILRHKSLNTTMIYVQAWKRYQNDGEQMLSDVIFNVRAEDRGNSDAEN